MVLNVTAKPMNDTIEKSRLIHTRLFYQALPRFPIISTERATHNERMKG